MPVRERVLAAYGGQCACCQTHDAPLEIDHIDGGGNVHRRQIAMRLDVWLWRQYQTTGKWPPGYQILCKPCHSRKSNRMPPKEGKKQLNIHLPDELAMQLTALSAAHEGSKSKVLELALRAQIEGTFLHSATDGFHQALASAHTRVQSALEVLTQQLTLLSSLVQGLDNRLRALEDRDDKRYGSLLEAFDRLKSIDKGEKTSVWSFRSAKSTVGARRYGLLGYPAQPLHNQDSLVHTRRARNNGRAKTPVCPWRI